MPVFKFVELNTEKFILQIGQEADDINQRISVASPQ